MAANPTREQLFAEFSSVHAGLISRIALSYEVDPALRSELIQDMMMAIWMALPAFRGESSIKTFAAAIAQKRGITHAIRRSREPRRVELSADLPSPAPRPDEIALANDQRQRLIASIQLLPIPQREAIVLCLEGFGYGEMADILGISANAVMMRCRRAKAALKAIMEQGS
jgi:RNA polymerase sigma-70 factor, ECF subfamily